MPRLELPLAFSLSTTNALQPRMSCGIRRPLHEHHPSARPRSPPPLASQETLKGSSSLLATCLPVRQKAIQQFHRLVRSSLIPHLRLRLDRNALDGYLIQVTMHYVEHTRGPPGRGSKVVTKERPVTKMVNASLRDIARADFVRVFLEAHALSDQYAAGPLSGPQFRLWWTGVK